ncbi:MAG: ArsR/SmtB family transcription factor [Thermoanaerobaculaceae bacterium]
MTPTARWVQLFRTLGHPARLRLLCLLAQREVCVCQLVEVLGLAFSTVSSHLALLRRVGLVQERKEGRWVYYQLAPLEGPLQQILETVLKELSCDRQLWEHKGLFDLLNDFPDARKIEG